MGDIPEIDCQHSADRITLNYHRLTLAFSRGPRAGSTARTLQNSPTTIRLARGGVRLPEISPIVLEKNRPSCKALAGQREDLVANFRKLGMRARNALKLSGITLCGPQDRWIACKTAREAFPGRLETRAEGANPIAVSARPHGTQS